MLSPCPAHGSESGHLGHEHPPFLLQIRPYLMSDGGNVEFVEIDGPVVYLRLQGACGSCPSSLTTMTMGIKRRLMEKIPVRTGPVCFAEKSWLARAVMLRFANTPLGDLQTPRRVIAPQACMHAHCMWRSCRMLPDIMHAHRTCHPRCVQEILEVEQIMDEFKGLELTAENVDTVRHGLFMCG